MSKIILLLAIGFVVLTSVGAQELGGVYRPAPLKSDATEFLEKYKQISALSAPGRRAFVRNASVVDRSNFWKVRLALYLVEYPKFNEQQKHIILDAISSPEFSAASNNLVQTNNMDPTFQALKHRAISAFNKNEVSEIFGKVGFRKSQGELLQNYNEISTLPMKQRKASFRNASARKKSEFWKTHIALYLAMHPELNEGQKETILVAMSLVPPQWFEVRSDNPSWKVRVEEPLREFENRILAFFSKEEGARNLCHSG